MQRPVDLVPEPHQLPGDELIETSGLEIRAPALGLGGALGKLLDRHAARREALPVDERLHAKLHAPLNAIERRTEVAAPLGEEPAQLVLRR